MNTIQSNWEDFVRRVIPEDASKIQVQEMKRSFYAGAASILNITFYLGGKNIPQEAGVIMLESLHEECRQFAKDVTEGKE